MKNHLYLLKLNSKPDNKSQIYQKIDLESSSRMLRKNDLFSILILMTIHSLKIKNSSRLAIDRCYLLYIETLFLLLSEG